MWKWLPLQTWAVVWPNPTNGQVNALTTGVNLHNIVDSTFKGQREVAIPAEKQSRMSWETRNVARCVVMNNDGTGKKDFDVLCRVEEMFDRSYIRVERASTNGSSVPQKST